MKLFQRMKTGVATMALNAIVKTGGTNNKFYEAFFKYLGGQYTQYDTDAKTYLEKGYVYNPDVYSIVNQKASKRSSIPFSVKTVKDKASKQLLDNLILSTKSLDSVESYIRRKALSSEAFDEKVLDFPMERPNPIQTWPQIIELYSTFMDTTGNFYLYMLRVEDGVNAGKPLAVYVLPSHLIKIVLKDDVDMLDLESPVKSYMLIEGQVYTEFMAEDVIHVSYANPMYDMNGSHLYGLSPLKSALRNIQSSNLALDNNLKSMANGGAFGFIHGKGKVPLSATQAQTIRERLKEMDADDSRMGKYAGTSGEMGFTRISLTTDELKPFEFLGYDLKKFCNVLKWESILLNEQSTGPSIGGGKSEYEMAEKRSLRKGIVPENNLFESALNEKFLPLFRGYESAVFVFNYDDLPEMQPDMKILTEWLNNALDRGVITRNEYRVAIRFVKLADPNMDIVTVSTDIFSLEEALNEDMNIDEPKAEKGLSIKEFDPNQPRDENGMWTDGSSFARQAKAHKEFNGSTFDQDGNNLIGAKGMASVSTHPELSRTFDSDIDAETLEAFAQEHAAILAANSSLAIGSWKDTKTGITWLDIVTVEEVEKAIILGREYNQIAIFDLENLKEITTGGTGEH